MCLPWYIIMRLTICNLIIFFLWWYTYLQKLLLVMRGVPFPVIIGPQVSVPLNSQPVVHYKKGGITFHLKLWGGPALLQENFFYPALSLCILASLTTSSCIVPVSYYTWIDSFTSQSSPWKKQQNHILSKRRRQQSVWLVSFSCCSWLGGEQKEKTIKSLCFIQQTFAYGLLVSLFWLLLYWMVTFVYSDRGLQCGI